MKIQALLGVGFCIQYVISNTTSLCVIFAKAGMMGVYSVERLNCHI